jgi:hypothetical protein
MLAMRKACSMYWAAQCEYSRLCDGYVAGILESRPEINEQPPNLTLESVAKGDVPKSPDCQASAWVTLARVTVGQDGVMRKSENCSYRHAHFRTETEGNSVDYVCQVYDTRSGPLLAKP